MKKTNIFNRAQNLKSHGLRFQIPAGFCHVTGEGNGNPLQCSCLENPMDRGAWQVT